MHDEHRERFVKEDKWKKSGELDPVTGEIVDLRYSYSGAAFTAACFRLRNSIFQALEYLPPGDVSFADYGRAIIAVDAGGNLNPSFVRDWVCCEFVQRGIVATQEELVTPVNFIYEPLQNIDLTNLINDNQSAQSFAENHREFLQIPPNVDFRVLPRQILTKTYYDADRNEIRAEEFLFKVSWPHIEPNEPAELCEHREVLRGTTLVIDLLNKKVRAKLTSDDSDDQRRARDRMLMRLLGRGLLVRDKLACRPDGSPLDVVIPLDTSSGKLRVRGTASMLHIVE